MIILRVGIYGLDLYSLHLSMIKVLEYLKKVDPEMEKMVKNDYSRIGKFEPQVSSYYQLVVLY